MSFYTKPVRPDGVPAWAALGADDATGTGRACLWAHDEACQRAGGAAECCADGVACGVFPMSWQEMRALAEWMLEQSNIARAAEAEEKSATCPGCGKLWGLLSIGHHVGFPLHGGGPVCADIRRPVTPQEFWGSPQAVETGHAGRSPSQ